MNNDKKLNIAQGRIVDRSVLFGLTRLFVSSLEHDIHGILVFVLQGPDEYTEILPCVLQDTVPFSTTAQKEDFLLISIFIPLSHFMPIWAVFGPPCGPKYPKARCMKLNLLFQFFTVGLAKK